MIWYAHMKTTSGFDSLHRNATFACSAVGAHVGAQLVTLQLLERNQKLKLRLQVHVVLGAIGKFSVADIQVRGYADENFGISLCQTEKLLWAHGGDGALLLVNCEKALFELILRH